MKTVYKNNSSWIRVIVKTTKKWMDGRIKCHTTQNKQIYTSIYRRKVNKRINVMRNMI